MENHYESFLKVLVDFSFKTFSFVGQISLLQVLLVWMSSHLVLVFFWLIIGLRTYRQRRDDEENITLKEVFVQKYPLKFIFTLVENS
jgi:heme/copper-type cytochrome/quinol oxidase subunit 2